ncbi:MAG: FAD-dependent oxidoreductase [Deltaproteobacteria bacterium]|jgi:NADH dehydrogenase FAD-containing subunit|nr:FAD-dependent oxidoreductase [Deltaproteobacteria bacterium]
MEKHLVLVGGGHAHLTVLVNLAKYIERGHRVTLIGPSPYHYYSGMGPGLLSRIYRPQEVRFHVKKTAEDRGATFIEDRVVRINPAERTLHLHSGNQVSYDIVSFNTGSDVPLNGVVSEDRENIVPVKPVFNLLKVQRFIVPALKERPMNLVVVGGGPAGLEVTANLWRLVNQNGGNATIKLIAGRKLLGDLPEKVRTLALASLTGRGITVIEGKRIKEVTGKEIRMADGASLPFDVAFMALGVQPSRIFRDSGIATGPDGGLLVNSFLQSVAHPEMFGGGDCVSFADRPLAKVGVYAVRQNPILFHNLLAALEGREMKIFMPQKDYMLIFNMGNGRGILWKKNFVYEGRLAFLLKDYIDRKFMKKFQVAGEMNEDENQFASLQKAK